MTNFGLYAICIISGFVYLVEDLVFTIPFSAKYMGFDKLTFFPYVGKSILSGTGLVVIGVLMNKMIQINSWLSLIVVVAIYSIISVLVNWFFLFTWDEKKATLREIIGNNKD
jgi:hypothetical protein